MSTNHISQNNLEQIRKHALKEYQIIEAQSDAGEFDPVPEVLTTENV